MITAEMKEMLEQIAVLCNKASDEIFENEETKPILDGCDNLADMIESYLKP